MGWDGPLRALYGALVLSLGLSVGCGSSAAPGTEGGACLDGAACNGLLDCVENVCVNQGASDQMGLPDAAPAASLAEGVRVIEPGSALQVSSVPGPTQVVVSGAQQVSTGDIIYSRPEHSDLYARVTEVSGAPPSQTLTYEAANLEDLYNELVVRSTQPVTWSGAVLSGAWAPNATVVSSVRALGFEGQVAETLRITVPEYNIIGIQVPGETFEDPRIQTTGEITGSVDLKNLQIDVGAQIKVDIDKGPGLAVEQAWIGGAFDIQVNAELHVALQGKGQITLEQDLPFQATFILLLGGIPTPMTVELAPQAVFQLEVSGSYAGIYRLVSKRRTEAGVHYENGVGRIARKTAPPEVELTPVRNEGKIQGTTLLGFKFPFAVKLAKTLAGPTITVLGGLKAEVGFTSLGGAAFEVFANLLAVLEVDIVAAVELGRWFTYEFFKAKVVKAEWPIEKLEECFPDCEQGGSGGCPTDKYPDLAGVCEGSGGLAGYCLYTADVTGGVASLCEHVDNAAQDMLNSKAQQCTGSLGGMWTEGSRCPANTNLGSCTSVLGGLNIETTRVYYSGPPDFIADQKHICMQIGNTWMEPYGG